MVKFIRNNTLLGYLVLAIVLFAIKYPLFQAPELEAREFPFVFLVSGLSFDLGFNPATQKILVIILLFAQGMLLQWVLVRHRFLGNGSPLIPFIYMLCALSVPDHFYFNDGIWVNFVILYLSDIVLSVYDKEGLRDNAFLHIGSLITVAVVIMPSMWVLFPFILIALSLFVVITDRMVWLVLFASVMMIIFLFSMIYLTGNLEISELQRQILPSIPSISGLHIGASLVLFIMLLFGMIGVMASIAILQLRANKIRNQFWSFVLLYLIAMLVILLYPGARYYSFQILVIPITSIFSFILINSKSRWFYEGFFILVTWSLFIVGIGYLS